MTYKEAYIELKERLEKTEYELRLMRQKQENGSSEQKRLNAKISGLMISLEYIHEMKDLIEDAAMTDWIKVDADHMPPDMEPVIVTIECDGKRRAYQEHRWNLRYNSWEWLCEASAGYWEFVDEDEEITHWMPYPEPAQD